MSDSSDWVMKDLRKALLDRAAEGVSGAAVPETLGAPSIHTLNRLVDFLQYYDSSAEGVPDDPTDSFMYDWLMTRLRSQTTWDAVDRQHVPRMRGIAGSQSEVSDASSFEFLDVAEDLFRPDDRNHMLNLAIYAPPPPEGPTGVGKSYFMYSLIEAAEYLYDEVEVATCNHTDPFSDVNSWSEFEEWAKSTSGTKIFGWDEAAQVLQFDDMASGKVLSQLIKLGRKYNVHILIVGHTGKDIPRDVRRMLMFALKKDQKTADIGAGLDEDSVGWMQIKNVTHRLKNIPPTSVEYDDKNDEGTFTFDSSSSGGDGRTEDYHRCQAENQDGEQCSKEARYPRGDGNPVYCGTHRSKLDSSDSG